MYKSDQSGKLSLINLLRRSETHECMKLITQQGKAALSLRLDLEPLEQEPLALGKIEALPMLSAPRRLPKKYAGAQLQE